jgi:hypothetical protein
MQPPLKVVFYLNRKIPDKFIDRRYISGLEITADH